MDQTRQQLHQAIVDAVLALAEHEDTDAFTLEIVSDTSPSRYVSFGEIDEIRAQLKMVEQEQAN